MARPWTWDADVRRYRSPNGRFIGQAQMLEQRDRFHEAVKDELVGLGRQVASGDMTLQEFVTQGRDLIKSAHIDSYVLARGGRGSMTPSDWGKVGAEVKAQYAYWQGFAEDIDNGNLTKKGVLYRAEMYGDALVGSYSRGAHAAAKVAKVEEQRNVLGHNDTHCDDCLDETDKGWVSIDDEDFTLPGERECGPHCHCSVEYRTRTEGEDEEDDDNA